jgi:hypothetical protein
MRTVQEAIRTRSQAEIVLRAAGVAAEYSVSITDSGPEVEIRVSPAQFGQATQALPFTIGSAVVKIVKIVKRK